jgi:Reverse transcriptase (RNA-dependent DNA polymerase)
VARARPRHRTPAAPPATRPQLPEPPPPPPPPPPELITPPAATPATDTHPAPAVEPSGQQESGLHNTQPPLPLPAGPGWDRQRTVWDQIKEKLHLTEDRYVDFAYLMYMDTDDKWVADYIQFHLHQRPPYFVDRLSSHYLYWESIGAPAWLVELIRFGVKIPFISKPPRIFLPNNKSVMVPDIVPWVRDTLKEYLAFGFVEQVNFIPHCVMPLQLKDNGTKKSLIYDMTRLNEYVHKSSFKLESWPEMLDYCTAGAEYAIKFDLKKFYHQIKLHPEETTYYGFTYKMTDTGKPTYFIWKTLPYGYTRAPFIARSLMKPLIAKWRRLGGQVIVFYDDGMAVGKRKDDLLSLAVQMQVDLLNAGLVPGIEKCTWLPAQYIEWNGLAFDFRSRQIHILQKRIKKCTELIVHSLEVFPSITYRHVSCIVGSIISMAAVFEGLPQIHTRNLQTFTNLRHFYVRPWDNLIQAEYSGLYTGVYQELLFWKNLLRDRNCRMFTPQPPQWIAWTDASDFALGGWVVKIDVCGSGSPMTADNFFYWTRRVPMKNCGAVRVCRLIYGPGRKEHL